MLTEANHDSGLILREKTMTDYIKREDAIEAMENRFADIMRTHKRRATTCEKAIASDMIETAKMVKSADVAPVRHGRWEVIDAEEPRRYGCSKCKRLSWHMDNYCPNCGARMDGEEDEID